MVGGKPDFSGIWLTGNPLCAQGINPVTYTCGLELPMGRDGINMGASLPGGLPYQPWLAALVKERTANHAKDDPHVRCPDSRRTRSILGWTPEVDIDSGLEQTIEYFRSAIQP